MQEFHIHPSNIDYIEELLDHGPGDVPQKVQEIDGTDIAYKQSRVDRLLWAYRNLGYLYADINPIKDYLTPEMKYSFYAIAGPKNNLEPESYELTRDDLDHYYYGGKYITPQRQKLRDLISAFKEIYCSRIGLEYTHIQNPSLQHWLIQKIESDRNRPSLSTEDRIYIQQDLIRAKEFERFIGTRFIGQKRFSLEGAEGLIPALHFLLRKAAGNGAKEIVLGMSHRGRLNVLANILNKPEREIFAEFSSASDTDQQQYLLSGDVKYHKGYGSLFTHNDAALHVSLVSNPSHLESVNPVVEGKARGLQNKHKDKYGKKVIPVLIHGDAAFSGQGIVSETLNLSKLKGYNTGGTIHIIVNNQIGFTTASSDARSTFFPSNMAKSQSIPIFHVNGYEPDSIIRAVDLALAYRQKFGFDAVIDLVCYRVHGHNESDEPTFTHPNMYTRIKQAEGVYSYYGGKLDKEGVFSKEKQEEFKDNYVKALKQAADEGGKLSDEDGFHEGEWKDYTRSYSFKPLKTGVTLKKLKEIWTRAMTMPSEISVHPKLKRIIDSRREMLETGTAIDWATGEMLAFGTLLTEGTPIRLSGEDSGRGTFSQRHSVWWDTGSREPKRYIPLNNISESQAEFHVFDSPLSEFAVLGFEYGYSLARPKTLTVWEAQFGDFVNEAQVIIDQYIVASESKWDRGTGLVLLLPHGFEGQGPEHSTAYLERHLQLCAEDNIQVCSCTTPAQYFHLLRRQMMAPYRKPLFIMAPKSLLRNPAAVSPIEDFTKGHFEEIISDANTGCRNLLLCSGKIYYELKNHLENNLTEAERRRYSIWRIEQFYPFNIELFKEKLASLAKIESVRWVQEEPRNRGGYLFIKDVIGEITDLRIEYTGLPASASPATGHYSKHTAEYSKIIAEAFSAPAGGNKK